MRQFNQIIIAMLAMSGRVTMLGISRWTGGGGSYRTILRFFHTVIPWATLFWLFFRKHLFRATEVYLLAGDEVVVSKSGKKTYGLDKFFSSLVSKPIPGLSFFTLSLVSVEQRHSFPSFVMIQHYIYLIKTLTPISVLVVNTVIELIAITYLRSIYVKAPSRMRSELTFTKLLYFTRNLLKH